MYSTRSFQQAVQGSEQRNPHRLIRHSSLAPTTPSDKAKTCSSHSRSLPNFSLSTPKDCCWQRRKNPPPTDLCVLTRLKQSVPLPLVLHIRITFILPDRSAESHFSFTFTAHSQVHQVLLNLNKPTLKVTGCLKGKNMSCFAT